MRCSCGCGCEVGCRSGGGDVLCSSGLTLSNGLALGGCFELSGLALSGSSHGELGRGPLGFGVAFAGGYLLGPRCTRVLGLGLAVGSLALSGSLALGGG